MQGDHDEESCSSRNQSGGVQNSSVTPKLYGGTTSGDPWDDGIYDSIREITLVYGNCIDSICVSYDRNGELVRGERRGGDGRRGAPPSSAEIKLECPDEFLVSISGYYCGVTWIVGAPVVLRSLKFESNKRTFGPFGNQFGTPFTFKVKDSDRIVGFKGRKGRYLDAIGFHSKPPVLYGGMTGGRPWDDGIFDGIREITLVYGQCIDSMCVVMVKLEYPNEFMVTVIGHISWVPWMRGTRVVRSLKFDSNRRTYGPFGVQVGTPFSFRVKDGDQIVGLRGRSGWYLYAIGFYTSRAPERGLFRRVRMGFRMLTSPWLKLLNLLRVLNVHV
ncbi:hypothetical protein ACLB2K_055283 [Fragaria x ananassa]